MLGISSLHFLSCFPEGHAIAQVVFPSYVETVWRLVVSRQGPLWPMGVGLPATAITGSLERVNKYNFIVYFSEMWQLMIVLTVRHVLF